MVVLYGPRRLGKTALLSEFSKDKNALAFTALQQTDALALRRFSAAVRNHFNLSDATPDFGSWEQAFRFIGERTPMDGPRLLLTFDEFPYAAEASPSLPSELQVAIDHCLSQSNVMLVLSGSDIGFLKSKALGSKSPLYGRCTAQLRLRPFDCFDASRMIPWAWPQEAVAWYAIVGGTPYYLEQIDGSESLQENLARLLFDDSGVLFAEPDMLLRQELRKPALYNSILSATAHGASSTKACADRLGTETNALAPYLRTLQRLGLLGREVPFGEGERSKRAINAIEDPLFDFWHTFVEPNVDYVAMGAGEAVAASVCAEEVLGSYVGKRFEEVCRQWVVRQSVNGRLPFLAARVGRWWGTDPAAREQCDIDVVAAPFREDVALIGECKWRNDINVAKAVAALRQRAPLAGDFQDRLLYLFSKQAVPPTAAEKHPDVTFVDAQGMFDSI